MLQSTPACRVRSRVLVLQRNAFVARSLARHLGDTYPDVAFATDIATAEAILADPERAPTHLVCGQYLGPDAPLGSELIPTWRHRFPSLVRVVLATTELEPGAEIEGVDAVFKKPASPLKLVAALQGSRGDERKQK